MKTRPTHRVRVLVCSSVIAASALFTPTIGEIDSRAAGATTSVPVCSPDQVAIHVAPGLPGMHRVTLLIEARNATRHACELLGLPFVDALGSNGRVAETAVMSPYEPSTTLKSKYRLTLDPGETASAQLIAITPISSTTSCPSYPDVAVSLSSSGPTRVFKYPLPGCAPHLEVSFFVPGFNGNSPGGEIVGTAPSCAHPAHSAATIGAAVQVDVWSGKTLAGSISVFAANTPKSYQFAVAPGSYLVTSSPERSRHVTVRLGRVENLGRFGRCSTPTTPTTAPGRGAVTTTTTQPTALVPIDQLTRIAFLSPSVGYGLFTRQSPTTCESLVGSTTDGGAVFENLTSVTSWACGEVAPVSELSFDDHGDGFLYGPDLFVTHDSGATWAQVPRLGVVLSVEALGYSIWAVETSCPTPSTYQVPCPLRLLESEDGGRTWDNVSVPNAATEAGFGTAQTYLIRLTATAGYLASSPPFSGQAPSATAPLWFTADSGETWSPRDVDCGISSMMDAISAAPDGTLVAVCASEPSAGSQPKSTVRSTDGGTTWTTMAPCSQSSPLTFGCTLTQPLIDGYLGEIDAVTDDTVFLVGGRSALLVTHDGGASWATVQPTIGDTSDGTSNVIFFSPLDGIVLGNDGNNDDVATLYSTSNGGVTWHSVVPSTESGP